MAKDHIPEEVKQFLTEYISSVSQLETLLLLHENKEKEWSVEAADRELRIGEQLAEKHLTELHRCGLLTAAAPRPILYRYAPLSPALDQAVDSLARTYKERRVSLIGFLFSAPFRMGRTSNQTPKSTHGD